MAARDEGVKAEVLREIEAEGSISFARYMDLCLHHPRHGYYTRGLGGGGGRDYLTSSGVHRAFGLLMARQAEEMWRRAGRPERFHFVEFGPGEGMFAADFLSAASPADGFARALRYLLVEPSPALRARQERLLRGRTSVPLAWVSEADLPAHAAGEGSRLTGCLFANEVLDAFPVHRVVGTLDGPREVRVAARDGRLVEILAPVPQGALARFLIEAGLVLEDGQEADINLEAPAWMARAVGLLDRGYVVVVDYGHEAQDLYHPARRRGTLLAYHRHRVNEDFLERPGEQDLTAHLDFTALRRAAEGASGRLAGMVSQSRFLLALGALDLLPDLDEAAPPGGPAAGSAGLAGRLRDREALKDLVLPGRMGERFRVLVVARGDVTHDLAGLSAPWAGRIEEPRSRGREHAAGG